MFDALGDWLEAQPPNRRRLSAALLGIILLTVPCYGVGGAVYWMSASGTPDGPSGVPTPSGASSDAPTEITAPPTAAAPDDAPDAPAEAATVVRRATVTPGPVLPAPTETRVATPFAPSATPAPTEIVTVVEPTADPTVEPTVQPPPEPTTEPTPVPPPAATVPPEPTTEPPPEPTAEPIGATGTLGR